MSGSANLRRTLRGLAVPLGLSLMLHGLLLLALWCFPSRLHGPTLSIESTRISLDTCRLDLGASPDRPEHKTRAGDVTTDLHPQLLDSPPAPVEPADSQGPIVRSLPDPQQSPAHAGGPSSGEGNPTGGGLGSRGSLFPMPSTTTSVVYVLDRSVSMGMDRKLDLARQELLASLRRLPPAARFQIIAYNTYAEPLVINGSMSLLPADPAIIEQAALALERLTATGDTDHAKALRRALMLHPDVVYFVTDADDLTPMQVTFLTRCNQGSVLNAVELSHRRTMRPDSPLAQLARNCRGAYRCVWAGD
jgi:hypothetical protein